MNIQRAATVFALFVGHAAYANVELNGPLIHGMLVPPAPNYHNLNGIDLTSIAIKSSGQPISNLHVQGSQLVDTQNGISNVPATDILGVPLTAKLINEDGSETQTVELMIENGAPEYANSDIYLYIVQYLDNYQPGATNQWQPLCEDPTDSSLNLAIAVAGAWESRVGTDWYNTKNSCFSHCIKSPGEGGAYECETNCTEVKVGASWTGGTKIPNTDNTAFTFGCRKVAAVAKCIEQLGYRPWASADATTTAGATYPVSSMASMHQACVRALRADYCGDGQAHTCPGTSIDVQDYLSMQKPDPNDTYANQGAFGHAPYGPEAEWNPDGAACISNVRYVNYDPATSCQQASSLPPMGTSLPTIQQYMQQYCPSKAFAIATSSCLASYEPYVQGGAFSEPTFLVNSSTGLPQAMMSDWSSTIAPQ